MRKRRGLARTGFITIALVIALGVMGVGYGLWLDAVNIITTVEVGTWGGVLNPGGTSANMTLSVSNNVTLNVTLSNVSPDTTYSGSFDVTNWGTVPIKIASITPAGLPGGVVVTFSGVGLGTQIDPAVTVGGIINVSNANGNLNFTETFGFVTWNQ